MQINTAPAAIY